MDDKLNNVICVCYLCCLCAPSACWLSCQVRSGEENSCGGLVTQQKQWKYLLYHFVMEVMDDCPYLSSKLST